MLHLSPRVPKCASRGFRWTLGRGHILYILIGHFDYLVHAQFLQNDPGTPSWVGTAARTVSFSRAIVSLPMWPDTLVTWRMGWSTDSELKLTELRWREFSLIELTVQLHHIITVHNEVIFIKVRHTRPLPSPSPENSHHSKYICRPRDGSCHWRTCQHRNTAK